MAGFWRLEYSDFDPPAPSSGKLGPFVGEVYQSLEPNEQKITNILNVPFPQIRGKLVASQSVLNKQTWYNIFLIIIMRVERRNQFIEIWYIYLGRLISSVYQIAFLESSFSRRSFLLQKNRGIGG